LKKKIFVFFCLSFICWGDGIVFGDSIKVFFPTRFELSPWLLDSIKSDLNQAFGRQVSLEVFQTHSLILKDSVPEKAYVLAEKGVFAAGFETNFSEKPAVISLIWGLGLRMPEMSEAASDTPKNWNDFMEIARKLKARKVGCYPWFESLSCPSTLLHLRERFSQESFQQSIFSSFDEGILNPLSLEADQTLAFEVLESGDCVFSTLWANLSLAKNDENISFFGGKVRVIPFPGAEKSGSFPRVDLHIFVPKSVEEKFDWKYPSPDNFMRNTLPCDVRTEFDWAEKIFPQVYNFLIYRNR